MHRETVAIARAHGWPEPSYSTVYSIIRALPAALVSLAHDGLKGYADGFELLYRREATHPTSYGKPITRRWICGCSMSGAVRPDRG